MKLARKCGHGSGSARRLAGISQLHVKVEKLIARLTGMFDDLTYLDTYLGQISTIAALSRPVIGYKKHYLFVFTAAPHAVPDGF